MENHNLSTIRNFLIEFFDDDELQLFAADYFRDAYNNFANGMSKSKKAHMLVEYCYRNGRIPDLLAALQGEKERPFAEIFPEFKNDKDINISQQISLGKQKSIDEKLVPISKPSNKPTNQQTEAKKTELNPFKLLNKINLSFIAIILLIITIVIFFSGLLGSDKSNNPVELFKSWIDPWDWVEFIPTNPTLTDTFTRPNDAMKMVFVPEGQFTMGSNISDEGIEIDETPKHLVNLTDFWIDSFEVSNAQYRQCVEANVCKPASLANNQTFNGDNYPAVDITWSDAKNYCTWVGRDLPEGYMSDLPTEAQWEYAARGVHGLIYPWGSDFIGNYLNSCDLYCPEVWSNGQFIDGFAATSPVDQFEEGKSWVGAYNMAGNVWEWVNDWYDPDYYSTLSQMETIISPLGPEIGESKVLRGGSWYIGLLVARSANRSDDTPSGQNIGHIGFRCVINISSDK